MLFKGEKTKGKEIEKEKNKLFVIQKTPTIGGRSPNRAKIH